MPTQPSRSAWHPPVWWDRRTMSQSHHRASLGVTECIARRSRKIAIMSQECHEMSQKCRDVAACRARSLEFTKRQQLRRLRSTLRHYERDPTGLGGLGRHLDFSNSVFLSQHTPHAEHASGFSQTGISRISLRLSEFRFLGREHGILLDGVRGRAALAGCGVAAAPRLGPLARRRWRRRHRHIR